MKWEDRRRSPRYPVDAPVRVMSAETTMMARVKDLCRDAVLIESATLCRLDAEVALALELGGAVDPLELMGRVIRLAGTEGQAGAMAVLFSHVSDDATRRIDAFLDKR